MAKSEKLGKLTMFNIILFGFIGQIAWAVENNFFNTFLFSFGGTTEDISTMVAASSVVAVIATFLMGTLSDKLGRRKVFLNAGYIAWGITVMAFAFISRENLGALIGKEASSAAALSATVTTVIIMDCLMTFMGSTSNDSAFNAWVTDVTSTSNRAKVEGLLAIFPVVALVLVTAVFGAVAGDSNNYAPCFLGLGIVVVICGILGIFTVKESLSGEKTESNFWSDLIYGFRPSVIKSHKSLYLSLCCMGIYAIASQIFFPYIFIYLEHQVDFKTQFSIPSAIIAGIIIIAVLAGVVASIFLMDKLGKAKFAYPAVVLFCVGLTALHFAGSHLIKFAVSMVIAIGGYGMLMILLGAAIRDFTPEDKAGQFQGVRMIFAVMLPMIIGPKIGSIVTENFSTTNYTNEYGETVLVPPPHIFLASAIVGIFILIPLVFLVKEWKKSKNS